MITPKGSLRFLSDICQGQSCPVQRNFTWTNVEQRFQDGGKGGECDIAIYQLEHPEAGNPT